MSVFNVTGIRAFLASQAEVRALVATQTQVRIHPIRLPQRPTLPAITYQRIGVTRDRTLAGPSGLDRVRMQADVCAETYASADDLAGAIVRAMDGHAFSAGSMVVQTAELVTSVDTYDEELRVCRVQQDWFLWIESDR